MIVVAVADGAPECDLLVAIIEPARRPEFRRKIVFLENYDLATATLHGAGLRRVAGYTAPSARPSGTSGMKVLANGALNLSTLDGWWDEAWQLGRERTAEIGWAIGSVETYSEPSRQDDVEAEALRATGRRLTSQVGCSHEGIHRAVLSRVQHASHGQAIHQRILPGCAQPAGATKCRRHPNWMNKGCKAPGEP